MKDQKDTQLRGGISPHFSSNTTDNETLHQQFKHFGRERHRITYKLLSLLPRIFANEIYKEKGYDTIEEYAGKLAGLSPGLVKKTLQVSKHLENKPALQAAVEKHGIHKVGIVAQLATPETDEDFADQVEHMNKNALQDLSKELRKQELGPEVVRLCNADVVKKKISIELDEEMEFLFLKLKKEMGDMSDKEVLRRVLHGAVEASGGSKKVRKKSLKKSRRYLTYKSKSQQVKKSSRKNVGSEWEIVMIPIEEYAVMLNSEMQFAHGQAKSRYIPVAKRNMELEKTNGRCAYSGCNRPPDLFHHRHHYSQSKSHASVVPLCKNHHDFVHNGLIENGEQDPSEWQLNIRGRSQKKPDKLFRKYRQHSLL